MASLWDQLRDSLGPGEQEEAKRILGRDRVRRNKVPLFSAITMDGFLMDLLPTSIII